MGTPLSSPAPCVPGVGDPMLVPALVTLLWPPPRVGAEAQEQTRAYVANRGATTVTVVDVQTGAVLKTIQLEAPPYDVVVAAERVFVSMPGDQPAGRHRSADADRGRLDRRAGRAARSRSTRADASSSRACTSARTTACGSTTGRRTYAVPGRSPWAPAHCACSRPATPTQRTHGQSSLPPATAAPTVRVVDRATGTVSAPVATGVRRARCC